MSARQVADGAITQMRRIWLGPKGIRWPVDFTFGQYGVGAALFLADSFLLWRVLPPVVVFGVIGWFLAVRLGRLLMPERDRLARRGLLVAYWLLLILLAPNPAVWVLPMPWYFAGPVAAVLAWLTVRRVGPYLDWNRPMLYWLALPRRVASGPRLNDTTEIDPEPLRLDRP